MLRNTLMIVIACLASELYATEQVSFSRDVRPILSENCFFCHGPDPKHREGDLRLDQEADARAAIKAGSSAESELFKRLTTDDPDAQMPPPSSHRKLSPAQIELLRRWIDEGAKWGDHWSFAPLTRQIPPSTTTHDFSGNRIDAWVQSRMQGTGLKPTTVAPRSVLLRRLALDLTGLPPSPEEVAAFENDPRPDAYERWVHRYLASPEFGQRMAWDWLDAARYADTNGYQGDNERTMWPWRDWVVDAMNENLPFDRFSVLQLAGDLIDDGSPESKLATGFCRNHMINGEGGRIAEENRVDYVMDMTETTGTLWLGLTLNCCRCHDHKYDPLTQQDYYQLYAFFNQTPVDGGGGNPQTAPVMDVPSPQQTEAIDKQSKVVQERRKRLTERQSILASEQSTWEATEVVRLAELDQWHALKPTEFSAEHQTIDRQPDDSLLTSGENPANDTYTVHASAELTELSALRLEALQHPSMTAGGLARSDSGNFVLTEIEFKLRRAESSVWEPLKIVSAEATFEQGELKVATSFDGNPKTGWAVWEGKKIDRSHAAVFRFGEPIAVGPGAELEIVLHHDSPHAYHNLGCFRLSVTDRKDTKLDTGATKLLRALRTPEADRTEAQKTELRNAHRQSDVMHTELEASVKEAEKSLADQRKAVPKVMVMADRSELRETKILDRGLYNQPTTLVSAEVPASLPRLPAERTKNRLALAEWLFSDAQPLTPRVTVNRIWQQLFGMGLVKTTEDFGVQGEFPLQIGLLDELAVVYRDSGWDTKALLREIMTSHVYQQSSYVSSEALHIDPENRYLARGARYRMPSWMLRDHALAVSGLLVRKFDGPGVNTYQPEGVWEDATFGNKKYTQDHGEALYRRSLYLFWRRIIAPTMFFDNASRQTCTVKALRTNTPLHALYTMNDTAFVEAARHFAQRALLEPSLKDNRDRLVWIYRQLLGREPRHDEQDVWLKGLDRAKARYAVDPESAKQLLAIGEFKRDERLEGVEHASWTSLCLALLNMDEALTRE